MLFKQLFLNDLVELINNEADNWQYLECRGEITYEAVKCKHTPL